MIQILAGLPSEYGSVVDHAKIDVRKQSLNIIEQKKRLKEKFSQPKREKRWGEHDMALSTSQNIARFPKK